jgi:serine/threonine protein kinase
MHLGTFLEDTLDMSMKDSMERRIFLTLTISCLTSTVAFIHQHTTKHMDIKPQNILVRQANFDSGDTDWRVYIADFGLSRSFASQDHSQTDGPTSLTPKYCAPEVYNYEERGRSADVFSLGCVFLEILTTICYIDLHDFTDARRGDGDDESFHANLDRAVEWARQNLCASSSLLVDAACTVVDDNEIEIVTELAISMVAQEPEKRPTAAEVHDSLWFPAEPGVWGRSSTKGFESLRACCACDPEPYEAYRPPLG